MDDQTSVTDKKIARSKLESKETLKITGADHPVGVVYRGNKQPEYLKLLTIPIVVIALALLPNMGPLDILCNKTVLAGLIIIYLALCNTLWAFSDNLDIQASPKLEWRVRKLKGLRFELSLLA